MGIESEVFDLFYRYQVEASSGPVHVNAIDQDKYIMIDGVDLPDIIFDAYLRCDNFNKVCLSYAGAYIYSCSVILSKQVTDTDK